VTRAILVVAGGDTYGLSRTALDVASGLAAQGGASMGVELWSPTDGPLLELARDRGITA
jgi:hypothetical protein